MLQIPLSKYKEPLFRQVYKGLREAILSGSYRAGQKLPSTRELAEQLRISRTVALLAYDQLLAEGFVTGRGGSGTYVSTAVQQPRASVGRNAAKAQITRYGKAASASWEKMTYFARHAASYPYDFAYGRSDIEVFPFEMWRRILLRTARKARVAELDYGPSSGNPALREAIAAHLRRSRAVVCDPEQIIVVSGSQQALDLIARVLIERGDPVALEDPSYQGISEVLRVAGARLLPVAVDRDGLDPKTLPERARLAFVTPSHQFPTGGILPLSRRLELLKWAKRAKAMIVEDDYDGEFHYEGRPLESLQGLDNEGRVIYIGTFSRTIFSSLRIGYLVMPKSLVRAFQAAKWLSDRHTATLEQAALAEFISEGFYERYLRRVRRRNARRRAVLLAAIEQHLGDRVEVSGDGAGAHLVIWPQRKFSEQAVVDAAAARGVGIYAISPYCVDRPRQAGILLGYSRLREGAIREGIRRLSEIL